MSRFAMKNSWKRNNYSSIRRFEIKTDNSDSSETTERDIRF